MSRIMEAARSASVLTIVLAVGCGSRVPSFVTQTLSEQRILGEFPKGRRVLLAFEDARTRAAGSTLNAYNVYKESLTNNIRRSQVFDVVAVEDVGSSDASLLLKRGRNNGADFVLLCSLIYGFYDCTAVHFGVGEYGYAKCTAKVELYETSSGKIIYADTFDKHSTSTLEWWNWMQDWEPLYADLSVQLANVVVTDLRAQAVDRVAVTLPPPPSERPPASSKIRERWAVVIGVSNYGDHRIPRLGYARKDAEAFHAWLTSADGGRYAPANVRLLVDKEATAQNIRDALFDWLGQALEEDLVTIYFSGHGTPQSPDRPENLFLVPYDADYDRISATGFPMWDIGTALEKFIKARKVVVIADACHAGGVGSEFAGIRRAIGVQQAGLVSDGLQDLAQTNDGVAVITSAGSKQLSQESEKWGGGQGVFTYYLLEGLKGEADYNENSSVTLGELTLYLSEQVRRATKNAPSP